MTEAQKDLSSLFHGIKQPIVCSRCANEGRQLATDFRAILRQKWTAKSGS